VAGVINISDATFAEEVKNEKEKAVLVDFWAEWCGPCRMIAPVVEEVAREYDDKLKVCKLNVDENSQIAAEYGIMSIPTLIIFKEGEEKERIIGYQTKEELKRVINSYV